MRARTRPATVAHFRAHRLRVSAAADGQDAVVGLLAFAEQLSARTQS